MFHSTHMYVLGFITLPVNNKTDTRLSSVNYNWTKSEQCLQALVAEWECFKVDINYDIGCTLNYRFHYDKIYMADACANENLEIVLLHVTVIRKSWLH